jgi:hypothetical protein
MDWEKTVTIIAGLLYIILESPRILEWRWVMKIIQKEPTHLNHKKLVVKSNGFISWCRWILGMVIILAAILWVLKSKKLADEHPAGNNSSAASQSVIATGTVTVTQIGHDQNNYYQGPSSNDLNTIAKTAVKDYMARMNEIIKTNGPELADKFDSGYILFTVTTTKAFFPSTNQPDNIFEVNWGYTNYFVEMKKDTITLHIPQIRIKSSGNVLNNDTAVLSRTVGSHQIFYSD